MDKNLVIAVIVIIVILGIGYMYQTASSSTSTTAPTTAPTTKPSTAPTTKPSTVPTTTPTTAPDLSKLTFEALTKSFSSKNFYLLNACASFTPPTPSGQTPLPKSQIPFIVDSGNRVVRGSSTTLDSKTGFTLIPKNILLDTKNSKYFVDVNITKDGKYATWVKTNSVNISGTNYNNQDTYFIKFIPNQTNDSTQIIRLQYQGGCCTAIFYVKDSITSYVCNAINFVDPIDNKSYQGVIALPPSIPNSCQWFNLVQLNIGESKDSSQLQGASLGSYTNSLPQLLIKCADYTKCN